MDKELVLLNDIANKCQEKPEFITHIVNACVSGISSQEKRMREQAADMETMAVAMLALLQEKRVKPKLRERMSDIALSKLEKYYPDKTFLNWEHDLTKK